MLVLCCFLDRGQTWTCNLPFPRAGRHIAVGLLAATAICLAFEVLLDFLLQQTQVQLSQRIRVQTVGIVRGIIANQRDIFQVIADSAEADGGIASQSLEQQKLLKGGVRGQARHVHVVRSQARATVGNGCQLEVSFRSTLMLPRRVC